MENDCVIIADNPEPIDYRADSRAKKSRKKSRVPIIIIVGVLVAALAGGAILWWRSLTPEGSATNASDAVTYYLTALSQGDATAALRYSAAVPKDMTFLTNEFLQTSLVNYPITNISVPEVPGKASPVVVHATYNLGDTQVDAQFTVQRYGRQFLLDGGFMEVIIGELTSKIPVAIEGVDISNQDRITLFPGGYTLSSSNPLITLTDADLVIPYPESQPTFTIGFALSEEGATAVSAAADTHLSQCLKRQEMAPEGCGFGIAGVNVGEVNTATIRWKLSGKKPDFSTWTYSVDPATTIVSSTGTIKVDFDAVSVDTAHLYQTTVSIQALQADVSDPDNIIVTFF